MSKEAKAAFLKWNSTDCSMKVMKILTMATGSPLPIIQNILFAFILPENSEISICIREHGGESMLHRLKKG